MHFQCRFLHPINRAIKLAQKTMDSPILQPPKAVRGMIELEKLKFTKTIKVPKIELGLANTASVLPYIKKYLLKLENLRPVQSDGDQRIAYLNPVIVKTWADIEYFNRESLVALGISEKNFRLDDLILTYEHWRPDEIFKSVLPLEKEGMSSFSKIGHIVHVNLKEHLLPYKKLIGQVILDKVKDCKTVVNKIESIDTTYRFFKMEVLCGEDNMQCRVKENHSRFEFDFSTVYWNPRLCTEHERISQKLNEGDVLYDVFAGVGPFAIPCAKKKAIVLANDLNPHSYKWLNHNVKLNKIDPKLIKTFNKDGREFIKTDIREDFLKRYRNIKGNVHITMNLPASAVEFLDIFVGLFTSEELVNCSVLPIVHVYCFAKGDDPRKIARDLVETNLGITLSNSTLQEVFNVRNVSPKKEMMRVSFVLTSDILTGKCKEVMDKKRKIVAEDPTSTNIKKSVVMGKQKKKGGKKSNVFKVAGSKSLKAKNKPKAVKTQLKKINVKDNVAALDSKLKTIQDKVRKSPNKKGAGKKAAASIKVPGRNSNRVQRKASKEATSKLQSMSVD